MTTSFQIDEICPSDVGSSKIKLILDRIDVKPLAHVPFVVNVDYSRTGTIGIALPIEMIFHGPIAGQVIRRMFTRSVPSSFLLTPKSGGRHLIVLREKFHNRWQGQLYIDVLGDDIKFTEDR